ncbi:MAG TPA: YabP/YqfC family sporulation protein [Candidatus Ruthenibacterium merdavium]|uniref:YabP/YqfC family sporulation protein n=1 Tax=Candidatus Ruthenibacterium merdavium TaxID=2838752 RepID=A0A9D2TK30_9FIRM|nr:YabP/YqfC family sporulation protein [Candidatus Ruthenibacterium merdavium]
MKRSTKKKSSLKEAFCFGKELTQQACAPTAAIHVTTQGQIELENCKAIAAFDEDALIVSMGKRMVRIEGDHLTVDTYRKNSMTVHGTIFRIVFLEGKEH